MMINAAAICHSEFRHFNWRFLNLVRVLRKLVPKDTRKTGIVKNDHVGIVFFVIVVLPAFVPPAEPDDTRPSI